MDYLFYHLKMHNFGFTQKCGFPHIGEKCMLNRNLLRKDSFALLFTIYFAAAMSACLKYFCVSVCSVLQQGYSFAFLMVHPLLTSSHHRTNYERPGSLLFRFVFDIKKTAVIEHTIITITGVSHMTSV